MSTRIIPLFVATFMGLISYASAAEELSGGEKTIPPIYLSCHYPKFDDGYINSNESFFDYVISLSQGWSINEHQFMLKLDNGDIISISRLTGVASYEFKEGSKKYGTCVKTTFQDKKF